jgi:adenosylcobinamide kinase/adenosylcobinamide-phosphate guanylyltransferase
MNDLTLITGGVKSGKSSLGLKCLDELSQHPLLLATARRTDNEMSARIDRHIEDRPNHWQCIECPIDLPNALIEYEQPLLVDCLGTWLTNVLVEQPDNLKHHTSDLIESLKQRTSATVLISNESGLGVIGADALTRQFVDELGLLNQKIAKMSHHQAFCISGQPLWLQGTAPF